MTKRSRIAIGLVALVVMTLGVGGFLAKAQIGAIMNKSPARDRPMQRAQEEVMAAFNLIEKAVREGDGTVFLRLMSSRAQGGPGDVIRVGFHDLVPRPDVRLEPIAVCVRGDQAFVVARYEDPANRTAKSYLVRYAREDGGWKIADQTTSDAPAYRPSIYAFLPPEGGAFTHAGLPWGSIRSMSPNPSWKIQATRDEAFLYVRFEAKDKLPAPDAALPAEDARLAKAVADGPPAMVVGITTPDDRQTMVRSTFGFEVARTIGSRAAGGDLANVSVAYSLVVRGEHDERLFDSRPGAFNRLIEVRDRFVDVRIPLKSLGLHGRSAPEIEVREASTLSKLTPYKVARFSP
jgi:hypothetical protein